MKYLSAVLLLAFAFTAQAQVEQSYDRFKDETTVKASIPLPPASGMDSSTLVLLAVSRGVTKPVVGLMLVSMSNGRVYGDSSEWRLILNDSHRLLLGTAKRLVDIKRGKWFETLTITLPIAHLRRIADASKVAMQIGFTEFELSPAHMRQIKEFVARLPEK